tara:strand:- start:219 stop:506 length:288 start_codon:yes stop_codon:yes gene_type:complete
MTYFVYLLISKSNSKFISYVGYTNNIDKRINDHNESKGAKFTKGRYWEIAYYKKYKYKIIAMKEEYKLKKNYSLRKKIKDRFIRLQIKNIKYSCK